MFQSLTKILVFTIATFVIHNLSKAQNDVYQNTKRHYNIGMLIDNRNSETNVLLDKLQRQIRAVVGEDAKISFPEDSILVNGIHLAQAKKNYQQLLNDETDIIIAFGVISNEVISNLKTHKKPTILFGAINQDYNDLDISKKTSGIKNFTYLIESESYIEDLTKLRELTNFNHIGIVIDEAVVDFLPLNETLDKALKNTGADYKILPFSTLADITNNLDGLDAVYMAGGFFLKQHEVQELAQVLIKKRLPSFTINGVDQVKNGIMASHQAEGDIDQFFRRISLTVEAYISGQPLSEMPVFIDYTSQLTINYNTAEAIGVPIKYSLINDTDFVGDFINITHEKKYDLISIIDQVMEKNLGLASAAKDIELIEQDVKIAKSNYLPDVSASVSGVNVDSDLAEISNGANPEYSTNGRIDMQQLIYSNSVNASINIQKNLQKAQIEQFNAQQLDTIFNAINTYFNILIVKRNAQIQLQNLKLTKDNLKLAQQGYEAGQSGKSDSLRFRSEKAQNTQAMVEVANQLEQTYIQLNQLLNNPVDYKIEIEDVELDKGVFENYNYNLLTELLDDPQLREPFIDFLVIKAKENAPELKALDFNIKAVQREIRLNGSRRFLPTISLSGQYNNTFNRSGAGAVAPPGFALVDNNYNVALNFSVPLFNKNQFNINRQKAIIQNEQLAINKQNTELSIAVNIRSGILNLVNQVSNIKLSEVSEATAKESLELNQTSYATGAVNIVQLIDAQNNYISAQLSKANAVYNFLINALQLERFLGYYFFLNSQADNDAFKAEFYRYLNQQQKH